MAKISLAKLDRGIKAKIIELVGGRQAMHRLSSLGLRVGAHVTKISAFALKGPVTVRVGHAVIAIGHGVAEKVIVETTS